MKDQEYTIRNTIPTDTSEIARIYNYYIENTIITFEEEAVSDDIMMPVSNFMKEWVS